MCLSEPKSYDNPQPNCGDEIFTFNTPGTAPSCPLLLLLKTINDKERREMIKRTEKKRKRKRKERKK